MKKLVRSRSDRVLFGVCGGFGDYLGVDANVVRVLWIAAALAGGIGVLPYVAAILLVPEETSAPQEERRGTDAARIAGLVLVGLGTLLLLRRLGLDPFDVPGFGLWRPGILLPLALLVGGALLVWPRARASLGLGPGRKLRRSVSDRVLAGVAGGIGAELRVDSNVVRLAFVLAAVLTAGLAVLAYLLLVLVAPEEEVAVPETVATPPSPPEAPASPPSPRPPGPEETPGSGQDEGGGAR